MSRKSLQKWDLQLTNLSEKRDQRLVCFSNTDETVTPGGRQMQQ